MPAHLPTAGAAATIDIFLILARRPHFQCIHRLSHYHSRPKTSPSIQQHGQHRQASTSSSSNPSKISSGPTTSLPNGPSPKKSKPTNPSRPTTTSSTSLYPSTVAANSGIPLHVGLDRNPSFTSAISQIPIPRGERGEKFTPSVLARPLGLPFPPLPGQNSSVGSRGWKEWREEFEDPEQAQIRRRIYMRSYFRPYFQEWNRVNHHRGKSFVSSPLLFKSSKAYYFPNIQGSTLASSLADTTPVLRGKISIIGMQAGHWAEEQVSSFLGPAVNPDLEGMIEGSKGMIQRVDINMQGDWMRAFLVKIYQYRLKAIIPQDRWDKYFLVKLPRDIRRGLTEDVRDAMGLLNSQVGYVYLVDSKCKIRWAGSGDAWEGEVKGLNDGIRRLMEEEASLKRS